MSLTWIRHDDSWQMGFPNSIVFFYSYKLGLYWKEELSFLSYSLIYISAPWIPSLCNRLYRLSLSLLWIVLLKLSQTWPAGPPLCWLICPLYASSSFFENCFTCWHKVFKIQPVLSSPGVSHFSRVLVPFSGEWFRNQDLGVRCVHCYWGCQCF